MAMSYEGTMLEQLAMPTRAEVEKALLITLLKHNGIIKEFASSEEIVNEIAGLFSLNQEQREAVLERVYQKENRIVKTPLWHRLLYRAADSLAKEKLVTNPKTTVQLTNRREWMLTEKGFDAALRLLNISSEQKENLLVKSYEVQKEIKKLIDIERPKDYNPLDTKKKTQTITRETSIRSRGFRQAVIESYDCRCCVCGLKMQTPDFMAWEVEAAHIVPHSANGRDDVLNGIALCRLHHWAFDTGWFSLSNDCKIIVSSQITRLPKNYGKIGEYDYFRDTLTNQKPILLPSNTTLLPHQKSVEWHRQHVFYS
ncbi:MAG: HNH endonuclease [Planctomycetaceae bacterium]|jgi:hypothetical protein|nr:HNH endonuclease [Planctomycetaceae bacterium]